jgi:ABC transporter C-terminal domain
LVEKEASGSNSVETEPTRKPRVSAEDKRKRARLIEIETIIDQLEADLAALGHKLENPPQDSAKVQKLGTEYVKVQKELEILMEEWGDLHG